MPGNAKKPTRKSLVEEYLRLHNPAAITPGNVADLRRYVSQGLGGAAVSNRYLLDVVEATGVRVARELGGLPPDLRNRVHVHDYAVAEASLREMQQEYESARCAGDRPRTQDCRRAVQKGKERLELLLRRPKLDAAKRAEKEEILSWFRVWLETPELFSEWLDLRKRVLPPLQ